MYGMKTDHLIGDRVSVRCRTSSASPSAWTGGRIIVREARPDVTRYVVQLDDNRRIVATENDIRRWTLSFELVETLERMAS
jgi:hypothetical protein